MIFIMKTDFHTYFHMLKSKTNNKGLAPIYLRLTVDNKRLEYSITRRIEPKRWSARLQRAIGTNRDIVEINNHINNIKHKLAIPCFFN